MSVANHVPQPSLPKRWVRVLVFAASLMLLASACGTSISSLEAVQQDAAAAGGGTADAGSANSPTGAADVAFTRGTAVLPRDLCMGNGVLLADVLHVDDLAAAGLDVTEDAYVSNAQNNGTYSVPSYPDKGQVNCGADLGEFTYFYFELHRDGRGLADNYEVREQHTIAGTEFTIYGDGGQSTMWAEALFPNDYSPIGATSLTMGYGQNSENPALGEDEIASALLQIAELVLPLVTYDPPAPIVEEVAPQGPKTPEWWTGCDAANFVLAGQNSDAIFAALGEPAATTVKLDDNPLGGLLSDCRASNGDTRVSIIAVPPIGGLLETVDDALALEDGAEERTVAGYRTAVYSDDPTSLFPGGHVQLSVDGFTIIVRAEDRDGRQLSAAQLKTMAVTAAEAFLGQL